MPYRQENVSIHIGTKPYVLAGLASDTPATLAAALALISVDWPGVVAANSVITLPGAANIMTALIGVTGTTMRVLRTQERVFQITV